MKTLLASKSLRLRRITSQRYIPEIDGLRFFAILPVLLLHLGTAFVEYSPLYESDEFNTDSLVRRILLGGGDGVLVFFAISGYILALPFAKYHLGLGEKVYLKKYFVRRLTRLEPPYLITLIFFFFVHIFVVGENTFDELLGNFLASGLYCHQLVYGEWSSINPVAWSLEVEVQFYLLVPILVKIFTMNTALRRGLLVSLIVSAPVIQKYTSLESVNLDGSFIWYYQYFIVGFLFADFYLSNFFRVSAWWTWIGLSAGIAIWILSLYRGILHDYFLPWSILLFFLSGFYSPFIRSVLSSKIISSIGGMCYITYLIHYPMMHLIFKITNSWAPGWGPSIDLLFVTCIWLPVILTVCAIAFVVVERPFMSPKWPQVLWERLLAASKKYQNKKR